MIATLLAFQDTVVEALPPKRRREVRRRFAEAVARMEEVGLLDAREAMEFGLISRLVDSAEVSVRPVGQAF